MFKVAFGKDYDVEVIFKEFNEEIRRELFELQVCFSSIKQLMFKGYKTAYIGMTLLDGVEEFINKLSKEFKNIHIDMLYRKDNDYLIKINVSERYNVRTRGHVIYMVCCLIRLFYENNFGKLGCKIAKVPEYLEEDIFKFIKERNKECKTKDLLHSLYENEDKNLTKEVILTLDNIKDMNAVAKLLKKDEDKRRYGDFAQTNTIDTICYYLKNIKGG